MFLALINCIINFFYTFFSFVRNLFRKSFTEIDYTWEQKNKNLIKFKKYSLKKMLGPSAIL